MRKERWFDDRVEFGGDKDMQRLAARASAAVPDAYRII